MFASAGLIPSVLEPGRIELLLSKPVSRTHILLGRYLGNVLVVSSNIVYPGPGRLDYPGRRKPESGLHVSDLHRDHYIRLRGAALCGGPDRSDVRECRTGHHGRRAALMIISLILAQTSTMLRLLSSEWSRQIWRALYYALPKIWDLGKITLNAIQQPDFRRLHGDLELRLCSPRWCWRARCKYFPRRDF